MLLTNSHFSNKECISTNFFSFLLPKYNLVKIKRKVLLLKKGEIPFWCWMEKLCFANVNWKFSFSFLSFLFNLVKFCVSERVTMKEKVQFHSNSLCCWMEKLLAVYFLFSFCRVHLNQFNSIKFNLIPSKPI